ncbi:hypothetical protein [Hymenobacter siberiensis]|uniref:hypothetical protein n=1 Tax=Hymenobacter siberiensis TaxID=2848396 RepID=UPI001C1DF6F4|nr:hypothetical protein [Hymenobacter siberiensis]
MRFICSQNKWRSLTAERLFDDHPHYEARSAGTEPGRGCASRPATWAGPESSS